MSKPSYVLYRPKVDSPVTNGVESDGTYPRGFTLQGYRVLGKVRTGANNTRLKLDCDGRLGFAVVPNDWIANEQGFIFDKPACRSLLFNGYPTEVASYDALLAWYKSHTDHLDPGVDRTPYRQLVADVVAGWGRELFEFCSYCSSHEAFVFEDCKVVA